MDHIIRSQQTLKAAQYIHYGLRNTRIADVTGLPLKFVRTLSKELNQDEAINKKQLGLAKLLSNHSDLISIIFSLNAYQQLHNQFSTDIDIDLLIKVHQYTCKELKHTLPCLPIISINDLWVLATSMLNKTIFLERCSCGTHMINAQKIAIELPCPFCSEVINL